MNSIWCSPAVYIFASGMLKYNVRSSSYTLSPTFLHFPGFCAKCFSSVIEPPEENVSLCASECLIQPKMSNTDMDIEINSEHLQCIQILKEIFINQIFFSVFYRTDCHCVYWRCAPQGEYLLKQLQSSVHAAGFCTTQLFFFSKKTQSQHPQGTVMRSLA